MFIDGFSWDKRKFLTRRGINTMNPTFSGDKMMIEINDGTEGVAQEGYYPVREKENEAIARILASGIEADRQVFQVIRDSFRKITEELRKRETL